MPAKESFDIDGLMVFRSDLTAVDQDGNIVAGVITPDRYLPSDREPLSDVQIGRYTNTTAYWKDHSDIVPANGDVYIYSDGATEEQGGVTVNIPKIKVGDGVTTIDNLPFTDSDNQSGSAGTLNTTNTSAQTPSASESLSGNVNLHKVAKTGDYGDLLNKPTIPTVNNATLTIQKNGTTIDTFTANAATDKTIDITVPTTAADVSALPSSTKYGASLSLSVNSSTFVVTAQLKDQDGNNLGNAQTIDLPLESVVVSGSYNAQTKKVVLTLQNGSTIEFSVADLVEGLQSEITAQNPLSADLVVDGTNNKVFTAAEKTKLSGIEAGAEVNVQSDWSQTDSAADDFIKHKPIEIVTISRNSSGVFSCDKTTLDIYNILSSGGKLKFYFNDYNSNNIELVIAKPSDYEVDNNWLGLDLYLTSNIITTNKNITIEVLYDNAPSDNTIPTFLLYGEYGTQADWNETNNGLPSFIKNKPTIPSKTSDLTNDSGFITANDIPAQEQSDWNETDTTDPAYIKNKPKLGTAAAKNVPSSGNASTTEVVMGNDSRLTDARTPTAHTHGNITNDGKVGSASGKILTTGTGGAVQASDSITKSMISDFPSLATVATSGSYNDLSNKPTIPTVPTNVSAFTNDAGYLTQETDPTVPAWAKAANKPTYDYSEINNTPTITDENVKQELTEPSNSYEYPLLASKTITVDGTKTNTTRYAAGLLARGDSSIILKAATDNTLDTPSLFFRRGSDLNTGTDWAIRSTGAKTGQNTPLEFLRRYGSGSSSWVSKLALYNNLLKTEVSGGFESPKFVKSNPSNANGILLADGSDIPQSTFQQALPAYTNNAGKILAVNSNADGVVWVSVIRIYDGSSAPSSSLGSDGDIYIQTQS